LLRVAQRIEPTRCLRRRCRPVLHRLASLSELGWRLLASVAILGPSSLFQEAQMTRRVRVFLAFLSLAAGAALAAPAAAAPGDRCLAVAEQRGPRLVEPASLRPRSPNAASRLLSGIRGAPNEARITYVGHSTFLIESAGGVRIATDYNDYVKPAVIPEIVTMNRAHDTHFTNHPEPQIRHVLRGWNPAGGAADHDVNMGDVRVRNVPTNIRSWGDAGATQYFGNSIFVFELADLCIAHLGHLHHTLNGEQLARLGQMDIVLVPVDGSYTLDLDGMLEVLKVIRAPLMIPMHYFSRYTLDRFVDRARESFEIEQSDTNRITVSRASLPQKHKILVLPPGR
jgi:L-ascorbate metabolism protein UlaG (beta-lactamase superfamily)